MANSLCPTCGALVQAVGEPDFPGNTTPTTMHYESVSNRLVRDLAAFQEVGIAPFDLGKMFMVYQGVARALVAEMDRLNEPTSLS